MTADKACASAAEILRARGVRELVYFHTDHFEPWRLVPGRPADPALQLRDVEAYVERSAARDFARRATLFYKANINFQVNGARRLWRADPADLLGFVPPGAEAESLSDGVLAALAGRELQVHIHHENITWNDSIRDEAVRAHLDVPANRRFDDARLELLIRLNLALLTRHPGFDPQGWFFVHGHWALNASDPHECTVVREIEILRRNGCLGDFTQPAGRPHVDSRIDMPYLARPVALAKGYDRPEAEPIAAAGAGAVAQDRFLIWAAALDHRSASIDHSAAFVRKRLAEPDRFARAQAAGAFLHDGVLYVKTHAHTMAPAYWQAEGGAGPFPHAHEGVVRELTTLFDAAGAAGAGVTFATTSEVFARLMQAPPARDDLTIGRGAAMRAVGCDVRFESAVGPVAPPALTPLPADALTPRRVVVAEAGAAIWPTVTALEPEPWWRRVAQRLRG